jgi:uncharacterized protein YegL
MFMPQDNNLTIRDNGRSLGPILSNNPMLVMICLDVSGSMAGEPISNIRECIRKLFTDCANDPTIAACARVCVVTFNSQARVALGWTNVKEVEPEDVNFEAGGNTDITVGLNLAIDQLKEEGDRLEGFGCTLKMPMLVLCSDGYGGDVTEVAKKLRDRVNDEKLIDWTLAIRGYDPGTIAQLSDHGKRVLEVKDGSAHFEGFFELIKTKLKKVSMPAINENIDTDDRIPETLGLHTLNW